MSFRIFRDARAILGESLQWDEAADAMWWCDISAGLIHRSPIDGAADGSDDSTITLPAPVASFSFAALDGEGTRGLVVSLGDRVVLTDLMGTVIRELAVVEHAHPGMRLNEGKADPAGRWVTGSMELTHPDAADAAFYSVEASGRLRVIDGGVGVANGLEWNPEGDRIWFTDTAVSTVYTGAYSNDGEITDVAVWHSGVPHDGLAMAADGTFWGAQYGGGRVVHYTRDAVELETIELPVPNLTSVALDGRGTLYVCSAREKLTEEQLEAHPLSGSVFVIDGGTPGIPPREFDAT